MEESRITVGKVHRRIIRGVLNGAFVILTNPGWIVLTCQLIYLDSTDGSNADD